MDCALQQQTVTDIAITACLCSTIGNVPIMSIELLLN